MKKNWIYIFIVIVLIILGIVISIIINRHRKANVNRYEFPSTIVVENHTNYWYADTMVMIILNKIYHYDTMNVNIYYAPNTYNDSGYELIGFISKLPYKKHSYEIFIKKNNLSLSIEDILSHELIHLYQMECGDLIPIDNFKTVYKGDTIYFSKVPYNKRKYEIYAFSNQDIIRKKLNSYLYSK